MKCQIKNRRQLIAAYLTGELSEVEMNEFEQHYFQCEVCWRELKIGQEAVNLIEREGPTVLAVHEPWWSKIRNFSAKTLSRRHWQKQLQWAFARIAIAALAMLLFIGLSLGYWKYFHKTPSPESYAENFQPSARLDNLIEQTYQSPKLLANVSPPNDANFANEILFRWEFQEDGGKYAGPLELRILNSKEDELFKFTVENNQFRFDKGLPPGVYYWALLTEEEMAYLGRFYVRRAER
jgi:hypothetical protein